ncbi:MAG: hypothetical protein KKC43_04560 [Alphaproteobacteria bacterium]|nr:hypothetical protein [Alphaproteobacteria bacterium]
MTSRTLGANRFVSVATGEKNTFDPRESDGRFMPKADIKGPRKFGNRSLS